MRKYYLLDDDKNPRAVGLKELIEFEDKNKDIEWRRVALDQIDDEVEVSTAFFAKDFNTSGQGKPILFETLIFGGEHDMQGGRYSSWDEAKEGHDRIVRCLREGVSPW